ncbi:MAG: hypothetical protein RLZZ227_801 [Pseudomonadota bacterium]
MSSTRYIMLAASGFLLAACSPAPQEAATVVAEQSVPPASDTQPAPYDTGTTIQTLMNAVIMPNVETLWTAVSYVATEDGVTETLPDSDADWQHLRTSALTLIEAGNMLMIPGREVMNPAASIDSSGFQRSGEEIAQLRTEDPETWLFYAQQLQETTRRTLQAIELRDVMGLTEWGAEINQACEGCHADYWYRPQDEILPRQQVQQDQPVDVPTQP